MTNEHSRQAFFEHFFENFKVILKAFFSEANVPQGLDAVCGDSVQRYFGLCRRYEAAYRVQGISSKNIESIVRVYTSHPKVLDSRLNSTLIQSLGPSVESLKGLCHCHACTFPAVHPGYTHFRDTLTFHILGIRYTGKASGYTRPNIKADARILLFLFQ